MRYTTALLTCLFLLLNSFQLSAQTPKELLDKFLASNSRIQTLTFKQVKYERVAGKMIEERMSVKLQMNPFKVYIKQTQPDEGLEVLYTGGGKARVTKKMIPTVSLDPYGSLMRAKQHHTLYENGFNFIAEIVRHLFAKYGAKANDPSMVSMDGTFNMNGRSAYKITLNHPEFKYVSYTVQQGESLTSIAKKLKLSDHMIMEKNKLSSYSVNAGQVLQVPIDYAAKTVFYLDKETYLPLLIEVYDEQGLYEKYVNYDIVVNPTLAPLDFDEKNPAYHF